MLVALSPTQWRGWSHIARILEQGRGGGPIMKRQTDKHKVLYFPSSPFLMFPTFKKNQAINPKPECQSPQWEKK